MHQEYRNLTKVDIIQAIPEQYKPMLLSKIRAKPIRTASGVAVVAVMCKPHRCPHIAMTGNICVYCPGGPDSDFEVSQARNTRHPMAIHDYNFCYSTNTPSILLKVTLALNLHPCVQSDPATTPTNKPEAE